MKESRTVYCYHILFVVAMQLILSCNDRIFSDLYPLVFILLPGTKKNLLNMMSKSFIFIYIIDR